MKLLSISIFIFCFLSFYPNGENHHFDTNEENIKGITMVAPPRPMSDQAFEELGSVNTEWVAFVPYGYSRKGQTDVRFDLDRQWWGERKEGVIECIKKAHESRLNVMLKPQVYIGGGWVGDMDFRTEMQWLAWEESYREFIMSYAIVAKDYKVEMLCVGTEYKIAIQKREAFWRKLIDDIRSIYSGKLVYSSNWDSYDKVKFWDAVDYIGVSSYFPLTDTKTPSVDQLQKKWKPIANDLGKFAHQHKKKILFTEYGYLTIDGCAYRAWELEKVIGQSSINQQAQANAYDALLSTFWKEDYWAGGFLWKWFPDGMGHEGYPEKDYTPQGKLSADIIRKWYGQE